MTFELYDTGREYFFFFLGWGFLFLWCNTNIIPHFFNRNLWFVKNSTNSDEQKIKIIIIINNKKKNEVNDDFSQLTEVTFFWNIWLFKNVNFIFTFFFFFWFVRGCVFYTRCGRLCTYLCTMYYIICIYNNSLRRVLYCICIVYD